MCGIAGYVCVAGRHENGDAILQGMMRRIVHRGPDESGTHIDEYAALGHRRLSIIDLATGQQPMCNEDGSAWIVYNGEIFNHAALRGELEQAGHRYRSRADTETILHAWEEYGAACIERFRGMFAMAVWDSKARKLFCARDRLGIKPFYYYWDGRLFAFASEIKALRAHPGINAGLAEEGLPEYLSLGYIPGDGTLFQGVRKLMPGHYLELDLRRPAPALKITQYWDVPAADGREAGRPEIEWVRECRARVEETVRMRLMSDVPLGVFLSGGVDSSAIAALAARMREGRLKTFSVGYLEHAYSELQFARQAAGSIGSDHHEIVLGEREFFEALPRLIWHEDEPITWPSSVSLYFVSRLAARHVKVVLTGEGADELFGGYHRYRTYLLNQRLAAAYRLAPGGVRKLVRERIASTSLLSAGLRRKLGHTLLGRECDLESLYLENFCTAFSRTEIGELLGPAADSGGCLKNYAGHWANAGGRSGLGQLLYADQKTYLVELLMKQDQMSMACSIESRVPFLDHPLVEFAAAVPDRLKIRNGSGKHILKQAVADLLPAGIVYRRKRGFPTPLRAWLSQPEASALLAKVTSPNGFVSAYLDRRAVREVLENHRRGIQDNTDRLWRLLNLELWAECVLEHSGRDAGTSA